MDEAYSRAINTSDTGYVARNVASAHFLSALFSRLHKANAYYCDYGAGYGMLVRMMRDRGFRFHYYDKYCENLFAPYCEASIDKFGTYEAVVAIEVFEHVLNPVEELGQMLKYGNVVVFTTDILPDKLSELASWDYLGLGHGQHVSFYSEKSLKILSGRFGMVYGRLSSAWHVIGEENSVGHIRRANDEIRTRRTVSSRIIAKLFGGDGARTTRTSLTFRDHIKVGLLEGGGNNMMDPLIRHLDL